MPIPTYENLQGFDGVAPRYGFYISTSQVQFLMFLKFYFWEESYGGGCRFQNFETKRCGAVRFFSLRHTTLSRFGALSRCGAVIR